MNQQQLFIKMVISAWETQNIRINKLLNELSHEQLLSETAPDRNTGLYLLGHLTAVTDAMFPLLGFGERMYPQLDVPFIDHPDKSNVQKPSIAEVKEYWKNVNEKMTDHIHQMQPDEWFTKHNAVSAEDFQKEPHRNKLNIMINRANHHSYHLGQLIYLADNNKEN